LLDFSHLDDYDVWACIKMWTQNPDAVLSTLSRMLLERKLFKIIFSDNRPNQEQVTLIKEELLLTTKAKPDELTYLVVEGKTSNAAYMAGKQKIMIKTKQGILKDIAEASDLPTIKALSKIVRKYYICWGKNVYLQAK
jgi:uncharacterized protein